MKDTTLPVMEHFYTVQGEGAYTGVPAYFIRLGGCDIGCVWCDVKESWDVNSHSRYSIDEIVSWVCSSQTAIVVITGGEPAMHNLELLTFSLHQKGYRVHIETSGAYPILGNFEWITLSPKKFKSPIEDVLAIAHELKVVVYNRSDFAWAEQHAGKVKSSCKLYLQPEWSRHKEMSTLIFDYVKAHPQWSISLQTHKFLGVD